MAALNVHTGEVLATDAGNDAETSSLPPHIDHPLSTSCWTTPHVAKRPGMARHHPLSSTTPQTRLWLNQVELFFSILPQTLHRAVPSATNSSRIMTFITTQPTARPSPGPTTAPLKVLAEGSYGG